MENKTVNLELDKIELALIGLALSELKNILERENKICVDEKYNIDLISKLETNISNTFLNLVIDENLRNDNTLFYKEVFSNDVLQTEKPEEFVYKHKKEP